MSVRPNSRKQDHGRDDDTSSASHSVVGGRTDESGLTQVGARLYDQSSGRFRTADPVIDNTDDVASRIYGVRRNGGTPHVVLTNGS